jgi:hypothetical protein
MGQLATAVGAVDFPFAVIPKDSESPDVSRPPTRAARDRACVARTLIDARQRQTGKRDRGYINVFLQQLRCFQVAELTSFSLSVLSQAFSQLPLGNFRRFTSDLA